MAKFAHANVLDQGPNYIKVNCTKMALISAYSFGDSYATVNGNILADVTMTSTDFTLATATNDRTLTSASGKQDASANATGGGAGNHIAFLNVAGTEVLWVTPETSLQGITAGNPVTFPSLVYTAKQPV